MEDVAGDHDSIGLEKPSECREAFQDVVALAERKLHAGGLVAANVKIRHDERVGRIEIHCPIAKRRGLHGEVSDRDRKNRVGRVAADTASVFIGGHRTGRMSDALSDQRTGTRFRVLVEIADRQPAVSQGEIAEAVGITSQAVSEYIRGLIDDGYVSKEGRSRYRVTKEGVEWLFREAKSLRRFADHVTGDVLGDVEEDAAIATEPIDAGETVTLSVRDGLLHATPGEHGPATGTATTDAAAGTDVSVTGFEGIIEMEPGTVEVIGVPPARSGGSRTVDLDLLTSACAEADLVVAEGVEAVVTLRRIDREPAVTVGAGHVAAEGAKKGLRAVVVVVSNSIGRITDTLGDANVSYDVTEADRDAGTRE